MLSLSLFPFSLSPAKNSSPLKPAVHLSLPFLNLGHHSSPPPISLRHHSPSRSSPSHSPSSLGTSVDLPPPPLSLTIHHSPSRDPPTTTPHELSQALSLQICLSLALSLNHRRRCRGSTPLCRRCRGCMQIDPAPHRPHRLGCMLLLLKKL
ncbi:hypothetical protein RIF29_13134 [Crotalaria pallida]|uniref:Uncharacterized protein n=1 Tax=Crotalaria pallida TaxID=3830 RepID=A0AAN9P2H9_CROPI